MDRDQIRRRRESYQHDLEQALERIRRRLAGIPEVRKAFLFGSAARGRRDLFTDLDLLVVMPSDSEFVQRSAEMRQHLQAGVDIDVLVYTPEEFERMAKRGFLAQALQDAQVIHEKYAD